MRAVILVIGISISIMSSGQSPVVIPLYKIVPNAKTSTSIIEKSEVDGTLKISDVTIPTLTMFTPAAGAANGTSIIICPGGGYWNLAAAHEGYDVAKVFTEIGVTAFVLKYRLPDQRIMATPEIGPLQDAQRAIQLVRERAADWNLNPKRIGILGFSAGGHLASTAGTHFNSAVIDNVHATSLRPDFMILIYPVISGDSTIAHKGSFERLLGKNASPEKIQYYSNELQVTKETPATFLVHASDDDAVPPQNSIVFYSALKKNNVSAELHIYERGGHGFGLHNKTTSDDWTERCKNWMNANSWLKKP